MKITCSGSSTSGHPSSGGNSDMPAIGNKARHLRCEMAIIIPSNIIKKENTDWFDEEFEHLIYSACKKAYKAEVKILDWIFEKGELDFLPKKTIEQFIQNRFNNSLQRIGMEPVFQVDFTELEKTLWFDIEITSTKEGDFFYKKQIDYNKKSKKRLQAFRWQTITTLLATRLLRAWPVVRLNAHTLLLTVV